MTGALSVSSVTDTSSWSQSSSSSYILSGRPKKLKLFIEARKTMALSDINVNIQEQTIQLDDNELKLKCPFKLMISGSSGAGKSR